MIVADRITAIVFETWLKEHLCPVLPPRSRLILANARFHSPAAVTAMAAAAGHQVLFQPPYSPDFTKIEHDFAALKKILAYAADAPT